MKILSSFGLFLVSEWIWAVTFARAHIPLNMILMLVLLLTVGKAGLVPAVLYAFFSQIFALSFFTLLVHGLIDKVFGITFSVMQEAETIHPFAATFLLAMIYATLQWLFFYILSCFYSLPVKRYTCVAVLSNLITMCIVYKFLQPM